MSLSVLIVAAGLTAGIGSAASAATPTTGDDLFSNDQGLNLKNDFFVMETPFGDSVTRTVTLTATQDLSLRSVGEYPTPGDSFYITRQGVCPGYFGSVNMRAGDSCTFTIVFTPGNTGNYFGGPSLSATTADGTVDFGIHLEGNVKTVQLSGETNFGEVAVGTSRTTQLTLTNVTRYEFVRDQLLSYLGSYPSLAITDTTCGDTLAAYADCTIDLTWTPSGESTLNAYAYTTGTMNGSGAWSNPIRPTGTTRLAAVGLTATPEVDFGTVAPGDTVPGTMTLTNTGDLPLLLDSADGAFSDTTGSFALAGDLPAELAPGASAEVALSYTAPADSSGDQDAVYSLSGYSATRAEATATVALHAAVTTADPAQPTTEPTTAPTPAPETTDPAGASAGETSGTGSQLAMTGQDHLPVALGGAFLLVALGALLVARRRTTA